MFQQLSSPEKQHISEICEPDGNRESYHREGFNCPEPPHSKFRYASYFAPKPVQRAQCRPGSHSREILCLVHFFVNTAKFLSFSAKRKSTVYEISFNLRQTKNMQASGRQGRQPVIVRYSTQSQHSGCDSGNYGGMVNGVFLCYREDHVPAWAGEARDDIAEECDGKQPDM